MADTKIYPRGRIALGSGDLIDVTNVKVNHTNNSKQVHTMNKSGTGVVKGNEETTISYDCVISQTGQERDYFALVKTGAIVQLRVKLPLETITVNGVYKSRSFDLPMDDSIKLSLEFIGTMAD